MIWRLPHTAFALCLLSGCAAAAPHATTDGAPITARRHTYHCAGGAAFVVTYISDGTADFARIDWNGQSYSLARAISASGARYAGLIGPDPAGPGVEWWEAKGEGTLSLLDDSGRFGGQVLAARCKPQP